MSSSQPWWHTWSVADVAATILPLFSSSSHTSAIGRPGSHPRLVPDGQPPATTRLFDRGSEPAVRDPEWGAITEAIQALEHAGLLMRTEGFDYAYLRLSRQGRHTLATNTVRGHLGLSDTAPNGLT
jgi:hypothetical protein